MIAYRDNKPKTIVKLDGKIIVEFYGFGDARNKGEAQVIDNVLYYDGTATPVKVRFCDYGVIELEYV